MKEDFTFSSQWCDLYCGYFVPWLIPLPGDVTACLYAIFISDRMID